MACTILERISVSEPLSETTDSWYLKLVTSPRFCLFTLISLWMPLALFVIDLVFSILRHRQVLLRLSNRASISCSFSTRASMSSSNRRLIIFLPSTLTFPPCSSRASEMICSNKMLKRVADRRHPCLIYFLYLPSTLRCSLISLRNSVIYIDIWTFSGRVNWCLSPPTDNMVDALVY